VDLSVGRLVVWSVGSLVVWHKALVGDHKATKLANDRHYIIGPQLTGWPRWLETRSGTICCTGRTAATRKPAAGTKKRTPVDPACVVD
jgi:hypothetical protein